MKAIVSTKVEKPGFQTQKIPAYRLIVIVVISCICLDSVAILIVQLQFTLQALAALSALVRDPVDNLLCLLST